MQDIMNRVMAWNAARYEQTYDHSLAVALLKEEHQEWLEATTDVDRLDALCDVTYVAMGVLWKAAVPNEVSVHCGQHALATIDTLVEANELFPAYFTSTFLAVFEHTTDYPVAQAMHNIIAASVAQALSMGLSFEQFQQALHIVCDANDSKSIQKVASNVKANIDKGPYFKSPEPRLQALLKERQF